MAEPDQEEQGQEDFLAEVKEAIGADFHGYDEVALDEYAALSFYLHLRAREQQPLAVAAAATCQQFGHDAPRGLCRRCGLGVELGKEDEDRSRKRTAERDAWLASRSRQ